MDESIENSEKKKKKKKHQEEWFRFTAVKKSKIWLILYFTINYIQIICFIYYV